MSAKPENAILGFIIPVIAVRLQTILELLTLEAININRDIKWTDIDIPHLTQSENIPF